MVRIYDPTRTDTANIFIRKCQEIYYDNFNRIQEKTAIKAVKDFLSDEEYDPLFQDFEAVQDLLPTIKFLNKCPSSHFFLKPNNQQDFKHFQGFYDINTNTITLCLQKIHNVFQLKENLDRELYMAYQHRVKQLNFNKVLFNNQNEDFVCGQLRACKKQFDNYLKMQDNLKEQLSKQCARVLLLQRGPNTGQQPYDIWVRQVNLLVEQNIYCYKS